MCAHLTVWPGVDGDEILSAIEQQGFGHADNTWLSAYGRLAAAGHQPYLRRYVNYLLRAYTGPTPPALKVDYSTYLGDAWATPIHIAICAAADPRGGERYLDMLRWWQEESSYMPMITPAYGLSQDYDAFLAQLAPALWALVASLMADVEGAIEYVATQARALLVDDLIDQYWMFAAFWALVVEAATPTAGGFEELRAAVARRGGVPRILFETLPGHAPSADNDPLFGPEDDRIVLTGLDDFRTTLGIVGARPHLILTAIRALIDEQAPEHWGPEIAAALAQP